MTNSKFSELLRHFFIYGFGSIAQAITSFVLLPIITNHLSTSDYGIYVLINMAGLLAGTVFYFGISSALPRSYFEYKDEKNQNSVLSTALTLVLIGAFTQIAVGYLFSNHISIYLFKTQEYSLLIQVMFVASAIGFINTFFQTYFRLLNKSMTVVVQGLAASLINFIVAIALFNFTHLTIWVPILSYFLSQILICVYSISISRNKLFTDFNKTEATLMFKFGYPTIVVSFTVMAFEWSDRFFLNHYLTLAEVGMYSFAYKFGTLINPLLISPFTQIWNPLMMKYKDSDDIIDLTSKVFTYYVSFGSFFSLVACCFLNEMIFIFIKNSDYHSGVFLIPIIMAGILSNGANNILNAGFFYQRKVIEISIICVIFAGLSLLTNYLLIQHMGALGAALSTFFIYFLLSLALYLRARKYFKIHIEIVRILFFIALNFGFIYLTYLIPVESLPLRFGFKLILILVSFFATLFTLFGISGFNYLKNPSYLYKLIQNSKS